MELPVEPQYEMTWPWLTLCPALTASDWSETLCMAVQEQASDARRALVAYFTTAGVSGADAEAMVGGLSC